MTAPSTRRIVEEVLDADALSALTAMEVRAGHLRIKPGVSVSLSLQDRSTGAAVGWARLLWPGSHVKADNNRLRARRLGTGTRVRLRGDSLVCEHGRIAADPRLGRVLARVRRAAVLDPWDPSQILRYNPLRRLVVADGDRIVKIWARRRPHARALHRFLIGRISVPEDVDAAPDDPDLAAHLSVQRRVGDADLARSPLPGATRAVGRLLAQLHAQGPHLPPRLVAHLPAPPAPMAALARIHAELLDSLEPGLARRLRDLAADLPAPASRPPLVLCHADASPDQVLVERCSARVWLTDFDRACLAPVATDLGAYLAAAGDEAREDLLGGYGQGGGRLPTAAQIDEALAASRMARLVDPLRQADPAWRERVEDSLAQLEGGWPWTP